MRQMQLALATLVNGWLYRAGIAILSATRAS
jgi:hypothetical protein